MNLNWSQQHQSGGFSLIKKASILAIVSIVALIAATTAFAQGGSSVTAQALGVYWAGGITGVEAQIWTAQQPSGWYGIASPVGVCTTGPTCTGDLFETGYMKGTVTPVQNVLQQFAAYRNNGGSLVNRFGLGNLSNNTWYTFKVQYCGSSNKWCAYRNGTQVYSFTGMSFSEGVLAACGGEGGGGGVPMGVECSGLKYRNVAPGQWGNYNYNGTQGYSTVWPHQYCVTTTSYQYGSISWKCQ